MNNNITIRKATEDDAANILEFTKCVRAETNFLGSHADDELPKIDTEKKILRESNDNNLFFLATIDNELVGMMVFDRKTKIKQKHRASFGIFVKKEFWDKKIGSSLMENMLNHAKLLSGLEKIELGVYNNNERAIALYKKYGFKEEGIIKKAYFLNDEYHDELIMGLFLK